MSERTASIIKHPGLILEIAVILCCKLADYFCPLVFLLWSRQAHSIKHPKTLLQAFSNAPRSI